MSTNEENNPRRLIATSIEDDPLWCAISNTVDFLVAPLPKLAPTWKPDGDLVNLQPASDEQRVPFNGKQLVVTVQMDRGYIDVESTMTYSPNHELVLTVEQLKQKLYHTFGGPLDYSALQEMPTIKTLPFHMKDDIVLLGRVLVVGYNNDQVSLQISLQ